MITARRTYLALAMVLTASFACVLPHSRIQHRRDQYDRHANEPQDLPSATLEIPPTLTFTPTVTSAPLNPQTRLRHPSHSRRIPSLRPLRPPSSPSQRFRSKPIAATARANLMEWKVR